MTKKAKGSIEIEIQVQIEKSKGLLAFLKKNAKYIGESHQIDKYFTPAHRNFTSVRPVVEWLRLRDSSGKYSINYKIWHQDKNGEGDFCDEYESPVTDLKQLENIFRVLNFKPVVTVDKLRKIWHYKDYEISMDSVKNLGDFVEVEYKGQSLLAQSSKNVKPSEIAAQMLQFLKDLDCGKIEKNNVGYAFLLLEPHRIILKEY